VRKKGGVKTNQNCCIENRENERVALANEKFSLSFAKNLFKIKRGKLMNKPWKKKNRYKKNFERIFF